MSAAAVMPTRLAGDASPSWSSPPAVVIAGAVALVLVLQ